MAVLVLAPRAAVAGFVAPGSLAGRRGDCRRGDGERPAWRRLGRLGGLWTFGARRGGFLRSFGRRRRRLSGSWVCGLCAFGLRAGLPGFRLPPARLRRLGRGSCAGRVLLCHRGSVSDPGNRIPTRGPRRRAPARAAWAWSSASSRATATYRRAPAADALWRYAWRGCSSRSVCRRTGRGPCPAKCGHVAWFEHSRMTAARQEPREAGNGSMCRISASGRSSHRHPRQALSQRTSEHLMSKGVQMYIAGDVRILLANLFQRI